MAAASGLPAKPARPTASKSSVEAAAFGQKHVFGRVASPAAKVAQRRFKLLITAGFQVCSAPAPGRSAAQSSGRGAREETNQSSNSTWFRQ